MHQRPLFNSHVASARSFLFVPAHRPERYQKALSSGADAVIIDLEDALPLAAKAEGRAALLSTWPSLSDEDRSRMLVRINPLGTPWYGEDLALLCQLHGIGALMQPKTESVAQIQDLVSKVEGVAVLPLIETARGVANVNAIAAEDSVIRLGLGHIDLQADLGMATGLDESELAPIRIAMVIASRLASIASPVDGVTTSTTEEDTWLAATQRSRRFGFGGKLCIHPAQIKGVHTGFAPNAMEVDWAQRVIAAEAEAGGGAFSVDGKMVDAPVILLAQQLLLRAKRPL
jgi:citrate lyase subunit beta / citryl-CoA lyase